MTYPDISFLYDKNKDIENIKIGIDTVRKGRSSDRELKNIIDRFGNNPDQNDLEVYISDRLKEKESLINISIKQTQEWWNEIESSYFKHITDRMQISSIDNIAKINGYFSLRYGSGYSATDNWFAVSFHNSAISNGSVAMHEIMHILFHKSWWLFCANKGVPNKGIWDIKESTTVLLNLWFSKFMINPDLGYEEHTELRQLIKKTFLDTRDFKKTLISACEFQKINHEKSPSWI